MGITHKFMWHNNISTIKPQKSYVLHYTDRLPHNCSEIRKCHPELGDDEYWLNVTQINTSVNDTQHVVARIYCYNMAGIPEEFITLPDDTDLNIAHADHKSLSGWAVLSFYDYVGETKFSKVKVSVSHFILSEILFE